MGAKMITFKRNTWDLLTQAVKRGDVAEITLRYYEMNREQAKEDGYVFPEETQNQQAASPSSEGQNAEPLLRKESQQTSPERTQDSGQALAELTRLTALLEDRYGLAGIMFEHFHPTSSWAGALQYGSPVVQTYLAVADRIRGYLKGQP